MLQDFTGKLVEKQKLSSTVNNFVFELDKEIEFKAGQFINVMFEENGQRLIKPYSIASPPSQKNKIELCIKHVEEGKVTPVLFSKELGFELTIKGPLGLFTLGEEVKDKLVFIAAGTGVSPMRSMIRDELEKGTGKELILIFGVRKEDEILFKAEFEKLQEDHPNFKFVPLVSRPTESWQGRTGHCQDNFDCVDPLNSQFYICGLQAMIDGAKEKLLSMGVAQEDIHFERYV